MTSKDIDGQCERRSKSTKGFAYYENCLAWHNRILDEMEKSCLNRIIASGEKTKRETKKKYVCERERPTET